MNSFYTERLGKLRDELPRQCAAAFRAGGVDAVYRWASHVAPRLYPAAKASLTKAQEAKAAELYADCFLVLEGDVE